MSITAATNMSVDIIDVTCKPDMLRMEQLVPHEVNDGQFHIQLLHPRNLRRILVIDWYYRLFQCRSYLIWFRVLDYCDWYYTQAFSVSLSLIWFLLLDYCV